jgi:hypothetical protein
MKTRIAITVVSAFAIGLFLGLWSEPKTQAQVSTPQEGEVIEKLTAIMVMLEKVERADSGVRPLRSKPPSIEEEPVTGIASNRTPLGTSSMGAELVDSVERLSEIADKQTELLTAMREYQSGQSLQPVFPTLELLEKMPTEQNTFELQALISEYEAGGDLRNVMFERLRWQSQEEILKTYGRPKTISTEGVWLYSMPVNTTGSLGHVQLYFISNYVTRVRFF